MAMIEGMTSIDLGTSPIQETTADINDAMPDEPIETSEERSVINKSKHTSPHICMCVCVAWQTGRRAGKLKLKIKVIFL